ncbi:hypothetical protein RhiirC2_704491 [Rhizophagus irregularis]|uniref:Uncharacterized protein n=1 Tax=Rhizophagus irregularis TaxID=588596 RepID=A0A2N1P1Q4_9GLOM|nr:hypothetical protein RhiirC2_704491 [Rhizophagus irregularis]
MHSILITLTWKKFSSIFVLKKPTISSFVYFVFDHQVSFLGAATLIRGERENEGKGERKGRKRQGKGERKGKGTKGKGRTKGKGKTKGKGNERERGERKGKGERGTTWKGENERERERKRKGTKGKGRTEGKGENGRERGERKGKGERKERGERKGKGNERERGERKGKDTKGKGENEGKGERARKYTNIHTTHIQTHTNLLSFIGESTVDILYLIKRKGVGRVRKEWGRERKRGKIISWSLKYTF